MKVLLVGLGGTGSKVVHEVSKRLGTNNKDVEFLCLDTDVNDLKGIDNITAVRTSTDQKIETYLNRVPHWQDWFPNEPLLLAKLLTDGASQIRSTSRLALESSIAGHTAGELTKAIDRLKTIDGEDTTNVKVMIVSSLAGGTGSGIVLQVPEILRKALKSKPGMTYMVRGLFILPDIFRDSISDSVEKENVYVNAYAVLKELNAMNEITNLPKGSIAPFKMVLDGFDSDEDVGDPESTPYNLVFTIDKVNSAGKIVPSLDNIIDQAANIIEVQLFSPVTPTLFSREDNRFVSLIANNGKNIYGSAAVSKLVYPYDDILNYVTTRKISDMITNEWSTIDNQYKQVLDHFRENQQYTPGQEPPKLRDSVIHFVETELENKKPNIFSFLKRDLLFGEDNINVVNDYYNKTKRYVNDLFTKDQKIQDSQMACDIGEREEKALRKIETAPGQLNTIEESLESYKEEIDKFVSQIAPINALNAIISYNMNHNRLEGFNAIEENFKQYDNGEHELFKLFKKNDFYIHPISARYIISKLIDLIDQDLEETETKLHTVGTKIERYEEEFDDPDTENLVEEPIDILNRYSGNFLKRLGHGYKEFIDLYLEKAREQQGLRTEYGQLLMYKTVFEKVRERLLELEDTYNRLFQSLDELQISLDKDAEEEELRNQDDYMTRYLLAKPQDKRAIFEAVNDQYVASDEFNSIVYKNLNESLYTEAAKEEKNEKETNSLTKNEDKIIKAKTILDIFKDTVEPACKTDLVKNVGHLLDRDVIEVLFDSMPNNAAVNDTIGETYNRATPLVTYTPDSQVIFDEGDGDLGEYIYQMTYWGFHPKALDSLNKNIDSPPEVFLQQANNTGTPEISQSDFYSPYELTCYNSVYGLKATELDRVDDYYDSYQKRVKLLNRQGSPIGLTSATISTVSPHLDIRWHKELPEISAEKELEEILKTDRSLLLSLIYGDINLLRDKDNERYYSRRGSRKERFLEYEGKPIAQADVVSLRDKAQTEFDFIRRDESVYNEEFNDDIKKSSSNINPVEAALKSKFVEGLTGGAVTGQNMLELIENYQIAAGDKSEVEIAQFQKALDDLIEEFATNFSRANANEIIKKVRNQVFETSRFSQLPEDTFEYQTYSTDWKTE